MVHIFYIYYMGICCVLRINDVMWGGCHSSCAYRLSSVVVVLCGVELPSCGALICGGCGGVLPRGVVRALAAGIYRVVK